MNDFDIGRIPENLRKGVEHLLSRKNIGRQEVLRFAKGHGPLLLASGVAMAVISYIVVKSGLAASFINKLKWKRFSDVEIDPPPPGTPLLEALGPAGLVEHSGLYLGKSTAAELHGDGLFRKVTLSKFLNGDETDPRNQRCGTKIFAACDLETKKPLALTSAVDFAVDKIDTTTEYNLLANNCHRFTASCILGEMQKPLSFSDLIFHGVYSIARLEDVIVERMNSGRDMCWLSVRRSVPAFDFSVSPTKSGMVTKN